MSFNFFVWLAAFVLQSALMGRSIYTVRPPYYARVVLLPAQHDRNLR